MKLRRIVLGTAVGLCLFAARLEAAEPELTARDLPRIPPVEPKDAVATFQVKKGFHIELVASEPLVASPVAMCFDEHGRLFVVEMIDYSERRDETPHLGRIVMLEDTNGDGIFDKSTVYADNLPWPTAVFCYDGGIFVGATPDIFLLKDTKGTGKADVKERVFTGFAEGMKRLNVQGMLNSFNWGLDNRIHGATSTDGGMLTALRHPEAKPLDAHGRDFVIEPRTMSISTEAGGGQHGLSFDDWGRRIACNNSDHIRLFMYADRYAARNPYYNMPPVLQSVAVDGPAAEVYRISPEEPWRVIRTRWRVAGLVSGPVEGGGRSAGYFTGATGTLVYRGDAFPPAFKDNAFLGDAGGNLVHRKVLLPEDVGLKAQRAEDEQTMEFAASKDTWFRPVQFANAPDGTLYVIDMYRETIEHPWSLPDHIKKFLDLNSGNDRGRIYRIVPDGFKQTKPPRLDKATTAELVATLENPNGWHRDTASRLLYERQDKSAIPTLRSLAANSKSELGRIHAMYALDGLGGLRPQEILTALDDKAPWVRVHAIKLSEQFVSTQSSAAIFKKLVSMISDPSNLVRYQLAFTLGEFSEAKRIPALAAIARKDVESPWIQAAVLSSLATGAGDVFADLARDNKIGSSKAGEKLLRELVALAGAKNKAEEVSAVVAYIGKVNEPALRFSLVRSLGEGLQKTHGSLAVLSTGTTFFDAERLALDRRASETTRFEAIKLLGFEGYAAAKGALTAALNKGETETIQLAAVTTLGHFPEPQMAGELTERWGDFSPRVKSQALSVLLARPDRATVLLNAIKSGSLKPGDLTTTQIKFLRTPRNKIVHRLAIEVLGETTPNQRQAVIEAFQPALSLKGDAVKGRDIYLARCSSCHRLGGAGFAVGPDLVTVKNSGKDKLLVNILDPSREVAEQYIAFQVETKDGESLIGIIANETTSSITLRQAYGKEDIIPRSTMKGMKSQTQSLMPEGLEAGLTLRDFANLLEYISTADANK